MTEKENKIRIIANNREHIVKTSTTRHYTGVPYPTTTTP